MKRIRFGKWGVGFVVFRTDRLPYAWGFGTQKFTKRLREQLELEVS